MVQQITFEHDLRTVEEIQGRGHSLTIEVLIWRRLRRCRKRSCNSSSCFLVDIGRIPVARQQSRFSFGAAFLIAANVHATQVHVFWLTLERSQSLANNRGRSDEGKRSTAQARAQTLV
ncbi:hypothetical protein DFJ43DRAFT_1226506 [Lentinula guzmanii]|uniref:Uncharacterized protein n=1 Tax=Lentinula guzmanii TaxID=2804957 RepID=A0AA38JDF8_9AGAR|nr:hypothetical protein DFJ43DRAFT_1226506 [Lentinula guzmanii]